MWILVNGEVAGGELHKSSLKSLEDDNPVFQKLCDFAFVEADFRKYLMAMLPDLRRLAAQAERMRTDLEG